MWLEIKDLSFKREQREILHNISLEVEASKITTILGANGSGKSTLLSLIGGLLDPDAGQLFFKGKKIIGPSYKLVPGHEGIALVKQDSRLTPFATVRENMMHVLRMYDEEYKQEKLAELSALLGLEKYLDRVVKFLSGGEQQRVAIAAALASEPELLLMDEPFSQTDMFLKQELRSYLFQIVEKLGVGLLFVTHSPEDCLAMSDTIFILHEGKIIEKGTSQALYYQPQHKATAYLTGYCSFLPTGSKLPLHQIGEEYLLRPDQIVLSYIPEADTMEGIVHSVDFCGFYQGYQIEVAFLGMTIYTSLLSSSTNPKKGETVWVKIRS